MLSTLLNLSYPLWVPVLMYLLIVGMSALATVYLDNFHPSATVASNARTAMVFLPPIAAVVISVYWLSVILAVLIGGGINAH